MILGNTRTFDKKQTNNSISDFIPYACHYNEFTILTKNGNLVQSIEIRSVDLVDVSQNLEFLRKSIKDALFKNIDDKHISFWIHTIRDLVNIIDSEYEYSNKFSQDLHDHWAESNSLKSKPVNTLYLSVVAAYQDFNLKDLNNVIDASFSDDIAIKHDVYLESIVHKITKVTNDLLVDLREYMPKQLSIVEKQGVIYSELISLYNYILTQKHRDVLLEPVEVSDILSNIECDLYGGSIAVKSSDANQFSSIISLKEYINEDRDQLLEQLMQSSVKFIATEIIIPSTIDHLKNLSNHQNYILDVSESSEIKSMMQLDKIHTDDSVKSKSIIQQSSIMIFASSEELLSKSLKIASKSLEQVGVIHVLEDINLENIFWSQLPGNFKFMRRCNYNLIENACIFADIHNNPIGTKKGPWGDFVTVIPSNYQSPYFLNFHNKKQTGHAAIFGNSNVGKSVLMNFLIAESMKYKPTVVYFGADDDAATFIRVMGGQWFSAGCILYEESNITKVVTSLHEVLNYHLKPNKTDDALNIINSITKLDKIKSTEELKKHLKSIKIPNKLEGPIDINKYWNLMDQNPISIIPGSIYGVNLGSEAIKDVADLVINTAIDTLCLIDGPKILVIDEMIKVLGPYYEGNMSSVLAKCKENNIIIIGTVDTDDYVENTRNKKTKLWTLMRDNFDLEIIMHHESTFYDLKDIFGLTEEEEGQLFATKDNRSFVMKPNGYKSTIGELNISNLSYYISILSPNEQNKKLIADLINKNSDPKVFLPEIYANLQRLK